MLESGGEESYYGNEEHVLTLNENPARGQIKTEGCLANAVSLLEHMAVDQCRQQVLENGSVNMLEDLDSAEIEGLVKTRGLLAYFKIQKSENAKMLKCGMKQRQIARCMKKRLNGLPQWIWTRGHFGEGGKCWRK